MINITESAVMERWKEKSVDFPLVSIRCLAYNHENYISRALDGFLMQKTNFPFEIIIHDDASMDDTAKIIKSYEERYPHIIRAIYESENQWSKHDGMLQQIIQDHIRGKYVALCEGDDYWIDENKLQIQISYMEEHEEYAMTYHPVNYISNGNIRHVDKRFKIERDVSAEEVIEGGGEFIATVSLCYRNEYGVFFPEFRKIANVGDYPLQVLLAVSGKIHYFPGIMANYEEYSAGSWSERNRRPEHQIEHNINEISWLNSFDRYCDFSYHISIRKRIYKCYMRLYYLEHIKVKDIKAMICQQYSKVQRIGKNAEFYIYRAVWFIKKHCNCFYAFLMEIYLHIKDIRNRLLK